MFLALDSRSGPGCLAGCRYEAWELVLHSPSALAEGFLRLAVDLHRSSADMENARSALKQQQQPVQLASSASLAHRTSGPSVYHSPDVYDERLELHKGR